MKPVAQPAENGRMAYLSHIVPYVAWITIMIGLDVPALPPAWRYALQTIVCTLLLLALRPWRWYARSSVRHLPFAFAVGVVVLAFWIIPELPWTKAHFPAFHDFYMRYLAVQPWSEAASAPKLWPYAPENCGWTLALIKLFGTSVTIAACEELFWRSFLYRWMLGEKFWRVDLGQFQPFLFLTVNIIFGFEHSQWFAGILAGFAFGWVLLRTRDISAAIFCHGVTNFLLGLYCLGTGDYHFW
jgi:CAAX prenyl protease-like protein